MRTPQQKTGDRLEQAALAEAKKWFKHAQLTKASGSVYSDGDLILAPNPTAAGRATPFVDCKGSITPGKGLSKADWTKIKRQAIKLTRMPVHLRLDHDEEIIATVLWQDLLALLVEEEDIDGG